MRISLERTGGFAGISQKTVVDTVTLARHEAQELPRLVEVTDFFNYLNK